jgi:hypothetical protein
MVSKVVERKLDVCRGLFANSIVRLEASGGEVQVRESALSKGPRAGAELKKGWVSDH